VKALSLCAVLGICIVGGGCARRDARLTEHAPKPLPTARDPRSGWLPVHDADLIVRVRMDFQGEPMNQLWGDEAEFVRMLDLPVLETLKNSLSLPWHLSPGHLQKGNWSGKAIRVVLTIDESKPLSEALPRCKQLDGKEALLFLKEVGDASGRSKLRYLFLGSFGEPVQPWSPAIGDAIRREVAAQAPMSDYVQRYLRDRTLPQEARVKALIEDLMDRSRYESKERLATFKQYFEGKRARDSFRMTTPEPLAQLELLGMDAVPAITKYLEDPRPLPGGTVAVQLDTYDHPGASEGLFHTKAKTVAEALNLALPDHPGQCLQ